MTSSRLTTRMIMKVVSRTDARDDCASGLSSASATAKRVASNPTPKSIVSTNHFRLCGLENIARKQESESRSQEPEEKKNKICSSGLSLIILDSDFWILTSAFRKISIHTK